MSDANLKGIFEPDLKKILLSIVILIFILYFAPCKVTPENSINATAESYWNVCGPMYNFQSMFNSSGANNMHFSFFGVLDFSDRALLAMSFSILIAYAASYAISSLVMFYLKDRMK